MLRGIRNTPEETTFTRATNLRASSMNAMLSTCPVSRWGVVVLEKVTPVMFCSVVSKGGTAAPTGQSCTVVFSRASSSR